METQLLTDEEIQALVNAGGDPAKILTEQNALADRLRAEIFESNRRDKVENDKRISQATNRAAILQSEVDAITEKAQRSLDLASKAMGDFTSHLADFGLAVNEYETLTQELGQSLQQAGKPWPAYRSLHANLYLLDKEYLAATRKHHHAAGFGNLELLPRGNNHDE